MRIELISPAYEASADRHQSSTPEQYFLWFVDGQLINYRAAGINPAEINRQEKPIKYLNSIIYFLD